MDINSDFKAGSTMKIDRLIGILSILLQKDMVTSAELAEKFEVSQRTILRDIDAIGKAGIPIVSQQGQGGGFYIMDGYRVDRTLLSSDDMKVILAGLKSLDSVSGTNRYRRLMDKICADSPSVNSGEHIIIDLSSWDKAAVSDKIELIKTAMEKQETISFTYFSAKGESRRVIEPYHLVYQWASWYVWGYCTKRCDWRMFKLTRMTQVVSTGNKRAEREVPEYTCDKLAHAKGGVKAKVRFDKSQKWRIIDEFGTDIPKLDEQGNIIVDFEWNDTESFYNYILTFGDKAEIISPDNYRREFKKLVKKIFEIY